MEKTSVVTILQEDTFDLNGELKHVIEYKNGSDVKELAGEVDDILEGKIPNVS